MGYSTSRLTLNAQIEAGNLDQLLRGQGCRWIVQPGEASKFAYKIREALYIARLYADDYKTLADAAANFTIEVVNPTTVQARLTKTPTEATILTAAPEPHGQPPVRSQAPTHGLDIARRPITTAGQQTEFSIIDVWQKAQPSLDPIHFPDAALSNEQLERLWKWAEGRTPSLMIMVSGNGLTLSPIDEAVIEYAWRPITAPAPTQEDDT